MFGRHAVRRRLDTLEVRTVPAVVNWTLAADGDFANAAAWTDASNGSHHVPGPADDAVIPSQFGVTSSANQSVNRLTATNFRVAAGTFAVAQPFTPTTGTTTVAAGATLAATVQLAGGDLAGFGAVAGASATTASGAVSPGGTAPGTLRTTGPVSLGGPFVVQVSTPALAVVNLINCAEPNDKSASQRRSAVRHVVPRPRRRDRHSGRSDQ